MEIVKNITKGAIIGVANLIPGVSGGTMALLLGIYERLIHSLNNISISLLLSFLKLFTFKKGVCKNFQGELEKIDYLFLLMVIGGALASILIFAAAIIYLLKNFHDPTYGFFFGLVLPSLYVPYRLIKKRGVAVLIVLVCSALLVIATGFIVSDAEMIEKEQAKYELKLQSQDSAVAQNFSIDPIASLLLFVSAAVAVSAMILPGVSGSFVLILFGQYFVILKAVTSFNIPSIAIFSLGLLFGIIVFTKFLYFLLKRFHDLTMGALTGLVAGSLWVIWPFKIIYQLGTSAVEGYPETIFLSNTIPRGFKMHEFYVLIAFIAGITVVSLMMKIEKDSVKQN